LRWEGGKWSLVRFYGGKLGSNVSISSKVVNGEFALSQKWIINKVTFIGLEKAKRFKEYEVETNLKRNSVIKVSLDNSRQFVIVEVSKLSLLIGQEFKLELKLPRFVSDVKRE
jgi:alpha-glucosidase